MANLNTSPLGAALQVRGLLIKVGTGGSPETENTVYNATDAKLTMKSKVVDITNFGDNFQRQIPTLAMFGPMTFTVFYIPEDASHRNSAGGGSVSPGLKYLWINEVLADWQILYPGNAGSTDAAAGYVTNFSVDAKTADVFRASVEVTFNDGNPSLC
jgi:hypothetical protein